MAKSLSAVIMAVWLQSSEQECVKRLSHRRRNRNTSRALIRYEVGENPLNRNDRPLIPKGEEIV